jgi:hypothetical protein
MVRLAAKAAHYFDAVLQWSQQPAAAMERSFAHLKDDLMANITAEGGASRREISDAWRRARQFWGRKGSDLLKIQNRFFIRIRLGYRQSHRQGKTTVLSMPCPAQSAPALATRAFQV